MYYLLKLKTGNDLDAIIERPNATIVSYKRPRFTQVEFSRMG